MKLSKAEIDQFYASAVWKAIEEKIETGLLRADELMANPDPFQHGKAVGQREAYRLFLKFKSILEEESEGGPYVGHKTNIRKNDGG